MKQQIFIGKKRYRFRKLTVYEREVLKQQKFLYSPVEAPLLIQQVVRQSMFDSLALRDFLGPLVVHGEQNFRAKL